MGTGVIICAAGQGKRMGLGYNKQFLELAGKPLLIHTLTTFTTYPKIEGITLVVGEHEIELVQELITKYGLGSNVHQIVTGGRERQDSVYQGLLALGQSGSDPEYVLVHDGARPFVTEEELRQVMEQMYTYGAAVLAVPVKDTIKQADAEQRVEITLDRSKLWAVQTPQGFRYALLLEAYQKARLDGYTGTDDASLVERLGVPIQLVQGSYHNIKLTTAEDIALAEYLIQRGKK